MWKLLFGIGLIIAIIAIGITPRIHFWLSDRKINRQWKKLLNKK